MRVHCPAFDDGSPMDPRFAFGAIDPEQHVRLSDNRNPELRFEEVPAEAQSLALLCVDPDVPSRGDDVNQEGRVVAADLPRVDFYHWVLVDISPARNSIAEGAASAGITARGKDVGPCELGLQGINDYTGWFAGDAEMNGDYGGYDGPCPPWNDSIVHHYHFCLYALDLANLGLRGAFTGGEALAAMKGHVLAEARWVGTYTLNPSL